jgi:hypothetical protein
MLCYSFLTKGPACSAKVFPAKAPLAPCGTQVQCQAIPHSTEQETQPIVFLINNQVVPY